ncbi:MAG: energy-coupling factor ABC transporter permease [Pseudomonadota bacterium]
MQLSGEIFSAGAITLGAIASAATLVGALRLVPWRRLFDSEQSHVYFGTLVAMLVLWTLRTEVTDGLVFHLSAMTALTLMFGWSLAMLGGSLVLAGVTLAGLSDWGGYPLSLLVEVAVPASLTQTALVVVRFALPRHIFIYLFVNAFFVAGLAAMLAAYAAAFLLVLGGGYTWAELERTFIPFFPLMFFPEAVLNGWIMTLMVVLRPRWVSSFRDDEYLHGK